MKRSAAKIIREYALPDASAVHGVSYDRKSVWVALGDRLNAFDPATGLTQRSLEIPAHAGTAFDGKHLYQIAENCIQKLDPETGTVLASIPAPGNGGDSGMAWAEGSLWVGEYRARRIHRIDPNTGKILRTIESNRFVTGVSWLRDELWHGTLEGEKSELRHVDSKTGEVLETIDMPVGAPVSGMESNGNDTFYCGGAGTGKVRAVSRPKR